VKRERLLADWVETHRWFNQIMREGKMKQKMREKKLAARVAGWKATIASSKTANETSYHKPGSVKG
jgi:hypothetical protein